MSGKRKSRTALEYAACWAGVVGRLVSDGAITGLHLIGERSYKGYACFGWNALAREAARHIPAGFIIPREGRLLWQCGSVQAGVLINAAPTATDAMDATKKVVASFLGWDIAGDVWSHGRAAKLLLGFIGRKAPYAAVKGAGHADKHLYPKIGEDEDGAYEYSPLHYHECQPGNYPSGEAALYDVNGAFYTIMRLIAENKRYTMRPIVKPDCSLNWGKPNPEERARFMAILDAIHDVKHLQRALWGASIGSYGWIDFYKPDGAGGSVVGHFRGKPGPFRPLGLVVSKTMHDLTLMQCQEAGAVYANVDSILIPKELSPTTERSLFSVNWKLQKGFPEPETTFHGDESPRLWQSYGLGSRLLYRGSVEVLRRGAWGFYAGVEPPADKDAPEWGHRTEPYKASRTRQEVGRPEIPARPFYKELL